MNRDHEAYSATSLGHLSNMKRIALITVVALRMGSSSASASPMPTTCANPCRVLRELKNRPWPWPHGDPIAGLGLEYSWMG